MNTKLLGFALMFSLLFSPAFAQDGELLIEEEPSSGGDDLFGGDFFSDLDSFLEEESDEIITLPSPDSSGGTFTSPETEPTLDPISNPADTGSPEDALHSSFPLTPTSAGVLPSSATVVMSVVNTSQDNADATQSGARPGDVLRYEIMLNSQTEDVVNFVPSINVSGIEAVVEFTNTGFGVLNAGQLVYPAYSHQAPCTQAFTFFVRVKDDCGSITSMTVTNAEAGSVVVPLNCGLAQTGPSQTFYLIAGLLMIMLTIVFSVFGRSRSS